MEKKVFRGAKWVECLPAERNEYTDFLDFFEVSREGKTLFRISAETDYALYLNGAFVGCGQYHDYLEYKVYDEYDVTKFVRKGKNRVAVIGYRQREDCSFYYDKGLGIIFEAEQEGEILLCSGEGTIARRSRDYRSGEEEIMTGQMGYSFRYDACRYDGWREERAEGFAPASVLADAAELYPRPVEKLVLTRGIDRIAAQGVFREGKGDTLAARLQTAYLSSRTFAEISGAAYPPALPCEGGISLAADGDIYLVIDLGKERAGYFTLDAACEKDCTVEVSYGEHLDDLRPRAYIGGRNFAFRVRLKAGRTRYTNPFRRLGARYVALFFHAPALTLYDAGVVRADYPVKDKEVCLKDGLRRRIFEVGRDTLRLCMHEHYEDTPWREQSLYAMDSRNQMLCGYYAFGNYDFAKASLRLFSFSVREDDLISLCAPMTRDVSRLSIMSFSLVYFVALAEYVEASGDIAFFREVFPRVRRVLENFVSRVEENGLIANFQRREHWNFYEWTEGMDGNFDCLPPPRYESPLSAFLALALRAAANCLQRAGDGETASRYLETARRVTAAIDEYFYLPEKGCYATFLDEKGAYHTAELTQSLVILAGAGDEARRRAAADLFRRKDNGLIPVSLSHSAFKYDAMIALGLEREVISEIDEKWGRMVFSGATSFWETEDGSAAFGYAGSLSHAWSAVPVYIYGKLKEKFDL